jgi:hypothetical protein
VGEWEEEIMKNSIRWLLPVVSLGVLLALPVAALAANLLTNGNFDFFSVVSGRSWNGFDEKVGTDWAHFYIDDDTREDKLHWFSSTPYELEGEDGSAQVLWSAYEYDAGIYQRVTGLTVGTAYGFDVPFTTFWRGPGYPDSDGIMKKQVGIDPTGGTVPTSADHRSDQRRRHLERGRLGRQEMGLHGPGGPRRVGRYDVLRARPGPGERLI